MDKNQSSEPEMKLTSKQNNSKTPPVKNSSPEDVEKEYREIYQKAQSVNGVTVENKLFPYYRIFIQKNKVYLPFFPLKRFSNTIGKNVSDEDLGRTYEGSVLVLQRASRVFSKFGAKIYWIQGSQDQFQENPELTWKSVLKAPMIKDYYVETKLQLNPNVKAYRSVHTVFGQGDDDDFCDVLAAFDINNRPVYIEHIYYFNEKGFDKSDQHVYDKCDHLHVINRFAFLNQIETKDRDLAYCSELSEADLEIEKELNKENEELAELAEVSDLGEKALKNPELVHEFLIKSSKHQRIFTHKKGDDWGAFIENSIVYLPFFTVKTFGETIGKKVPTENLGMAYGNFIVLIRDFIEKMQKVGASFQWIEGCAEMFNSDDDKAWDAMKKAKKLGNFYIDIKKEFVKTEIPNKEAILSLFTNDGEQVICLGFAIFDINDNPVLIENFYLLDFDKGMEEATSYFVDRAKEFEVSQINYVTIPTVEICSCCRDLSYRSRNKENDENQANGSTPYTGLTFEERAKEFADYLRERQRVKGILSEEEIVSLSDMGIISSYRFCAGCGEPFYSQAEERQAILEFDCPQDSYDATESMIDNHQHKKG